MSEANNVVGRARPPGAPLTARLPYFRTPERIAALHAQLAKWQGARWGHAGTRPNEMRCGVTGDCLFWVHVFKAIGALPESIVVPNYRVHEAAADKMTLLRDRIEATGRAQLISGAGVSPANQSPPRLCPGDVLLFHNGMSGAHCGLIVKASPVHFVHLSKNGLLEEPFAQAHWLRDLAFVYRLLEDGGPRSVVAPCGRNEARPSTSETRA